MTRALQSSSLDSMSPQEATRPGSRGVAAIVRRGGLPMLLMLLGTVVTAGGCTLLLPFADPPSDAASDGSLDADPDAIGARCGDGVLNPGEECDQAAANSDTVPDACRTSCDRPGCGDGVVDTGEQCDQGADNSDIAANACRTSCDRPGCGDGVIDTGEECDDASANSDIAPDACRTDCLLHTCGDGVVDTGEDCDDATANSDTEPNACRSGCTLPACGDGVLDAGEGCDDGNLTPGDGCDADCAPLPCDSVASLLFQFGCTPGEACDVDGTQGISCRSAGSTPDYNPCTSLTDCGVGATCVEMADTARCHPFCSTAELGTATGVPPGRGICLDTLSTADGPVAVRVQEVACDPVDNTGCGSYLGNSACYIVTGYTFCLPGGLRLVGQSCDPLDQRCLPQYYCTSSGGTCQASCHLPDAGDCTLGKHCTGSTGNAAYGYCQ